MPSNNGHGLQPERVALYMRVSSEEQVERHSIGTQEEFLEQYCDLYSMDVAGVYRDEGISGTVSMHERPGGGRLLDDARGGKLDVVLVYKLDRIGRTLLNVVDAHDRLDAAGVALRSATEPIDTSTPSGRLIFHMLASFAEFERGTIRERTQDGLHRYWRAGKHSGRIPYGYDVGEDGRFAVVEEEAEIVRGIIANIAAGSTLYKEAARLNALGVPAPGYRYAGSARKHGTEWSTRTIHNICRQGAYSGAHIVKASGKRGAIERETPAIVELGVQRRAIDRLAENKRRYNRSTDRKYLLSGLVRCAVCDSACVGHPTTSKGKKLYYYKCSDDHKTRRRRAPANHAPYVRAEWVEGLVWEDVRRFLRNPGEILERMKEDAHDGEAGALERRRDDLRKRLRQTQAEKDRYVKLYAQGRIDDAELGTHLQDVSIRADNIRLLLDSIEADLSRKDEQKQLAETTAAWLTALRARIADVEADTEEAYATRQELVRLLVESIAAGRDEQGRVRLEITYRFGPPADEAGGAVQDRNAGGEQDVVVDSLPNP